MVDVATLTSLAGILSTLRGLGELATKKQDAEFNAKVIELQQAILELQSGLAQLQAENAALKSENTTLKNLDGIEKSLVFEAGVYWKIIDEQKHGPYCPTCWDADRRLVRLSWQHNAKRFHCDLHDILFVASSREKPGGY